MQGIGRNRGHAEARVSNSSLVSALACRANSNIANSSSTAWFLPLETAPKGGSPLKPAPRIASDYRSSGFADLSRRLILAGGCPKGDIHAIPAIDYRDGQRQVGQI